MPPIESKDAERELFEAHLENEPWHQVMVLAKDEDSDGASVYRMCRMAAKQAWDARAALVAPAQPADKDGALYRELLFAVGRKYSGETRHQTALRYIQQAEHSNAVAAIDAAMHKEQS